jgi:hypothetical protein
MLASDMMRPGFWLTALQIMSINILLSGDNESSSRSRAARLRRSSGDGA